MHAFGPTQPAIRKLLVAWRDCDAFTRRSTCGRVDIPEVGSYILHDQSNACPIYIQFLIVTDNQMVGSQMLSKLIRFDLSGSALPFIHWFRLLFARILTNQFLIVVVDFDRSSAGEAGRGIMGRGPPDRWLVP